MLVTFDTNAGAFKSVVPNYVEGSGETIEIVLPMHPEQCPCCIDLAFSHVEQYVQDNLHELYSLLDGLKGKHLRAALADLYLEKQHQWEEMGAILAFMGEDVEGGGAEDFYALQEDLKFLGLLMSCKKNEIKDRLRLVSVAIDPVSPEITLFFGVDEVSFPVIFLQSCDLGN